LSKPKLPFYELEFSGDAIFWTEQGAARRHVFLMPVPIPSEFVAFGVLGEKYEPHFVARGKVHAHLSDFLARMKQDGARTEIYARAPLPGWLLKKYTDDPHHEGHEHEEPPPPPVDGLVPGSTDPYERFRHSALWSAEASTARYVFVLPIHGAPSTFLALGTSGPEDRVFFALTGSVEADLGEFVTRMVKEEAQVELRARPPLPDPVLRKYLVDPPVATPFR
jgi:hypothetical protein